MLSKPSSVFVEKFFLLNAGVLILTFLAYNFGTSRTPPAEDVLIYNIYSDQILGGQFPYRDFVLEYPPFALFFFLLPGIVGKLSGMASPESYILFFNLECLLLLLLTLFFLWKLLDQYYPPDFGKKYMILMTLATILFAFYVYRRFDMAPVFLVVLAFYLLGRGKPILSSIFFGLATVTKIYPVLLLPLVVLYLWRKRKKWSQVLGTLLGFSATVAITTLPFLFASPSGFLTFLKFQSERSVEIESFYASIIWLGRCLGLIQASSSIDHNSVNLSSPWSGFLSAASPVLLIVGTLAFYGYWLKVKGRELDFNWLFEAGGFITLWFILSNKVFSPQYLVWLLPYACLWWGFKICLFYAALVFTFIVFPLMGTQTIATEWFPMLILLLRNGCLVALLILQGRSLLWPKPLPLVTEHFSLIAKLKEYRRLT